MAQPADSQELLSKLYPPPSKNWTRHAYHASYLIDGYVYINGGEVTIGEVPYSKGLMNASYTTLPMNHTISFPLSKSWDTTLDVQYTLTPKRNTPSFNWADIMYDQSNSSFYVFGGEKSELDPLAVDLSVQEFQLNNGGGGTWQENTTALQPPFADNPGIGRPVGGGFTQTNQTAFYLGGYINSRSTPLVYDFFASIPAPGLITYDFASGAWTNSTTGLTNLDSQGNFYYGGMEFLPTFGPNGLILIWGGDTSNNTLYWTGSSPQRPMNTMTLLDPVTRDWYTQAIPGEVPSSRAKFCAIHVADSRPLKSEAKNATGSGSHDIYMYAGYNGNLTAGNEQFDEVWVFSLPGFVWQRVDASHNQARFGHTCHLVGNRQLMTIGGGDPNLPAPWNSTDQFTNGIGVFDLVDSKWTTGYNANAAQYQRPKVLQDWYDKNGAYPKTWSSPLVQNLFIPGSAAISTNTSSTNTTTAPMSASPSHSNSTHIAIIIASTIAVLLAALVPFIGLIWYIRKKYKSHDDAYLAEMNAEDILRYEMCSGGKSRNLSEYGELYGGGKSSRGGSAYAGSGYYRPGGNYHRSWMSGHGRYSRGRSRTGRFFAELDASSRRSHQSGAGAGAARSRAGDTPTALAFPDAKLKEVLRERKGSGWHPSEKGLEIGLGLSPGLTYRDGPRSRSSKGSEGTSSKWSSHLSGSSYPMSPRSGSGRVGKSGGSSPRKGAMSPQKEKGWGG